MTFILHNNENYGLTTGQASSTTRKGVKTNSTPEGVSVAPLNVMEFVLGLNPSFAARTFSGDVKHMTEVLRAAFKHKGFSFVEIFQNCPSYNHETPHEWYQERVYDIGKVEGYDKTNLASAKEVSDDMENHIAVGLIYENNTIPAFLDLEIGREGKTTQLVDEVSSPDILALLASYK